MLRSAFLKFALTVKETKDATAKEAATFMRQLERTKTERSLLASIRAFVQQATRGEQKSESKTTRLLADLDQKHSDPPADEQEDPVVNLKNKYRGQNRDTESDKSARVRRDFERSIKYSMGRGTHL